MVMLWLFKFLHRKAFSMSSNYMMMFCFVVDQVVVVVGNSLSGQDISQELVEVAKEIHISTKSINTISVGLSKVIDKHQNLHLHPQVINFLF